MVRIVLGNGLDEPGTVEVDAVTLGEALEKIQERVPWLEQADPRVFIDGVDAERLEGAKTPVGDEDTILLTTY